MGNLENFIYGRYFHYLADSGSNFVDNVSKFYSTGDTGSIIFLNQRILESTEMMEKDANYYRRTSRVGAASALGIETFAAFSYYQDHPFIAAFLAIGGLFAASLSLVSHNNHRINQINNDRIKKSLISDPNLVRRVLNEFRDDIEWQTRKH